MTDINAVEAVTVAAVQPVAYQQPLAIAEKEGVITLPDGRTFKIVKDEPKKAESSFGQRAWGVFTSIIGSPVARAVVVTASVILIKTAESMILKKVPTLPGGTEVQAVGTQLVTGVASELTKSVTKI